MALFLFAFVGNSLYVASILTNPLSSTPGFLLESMPYLLGSGGTLCFDLVILTQSRLYSDKRKARRERDRKRRFARTLEAEEEAALLHADEDGETDTETGSRPRRPTHKSRSLSGKRSRSTSTLGYGRSISSRSGRTLSSSRRSDSTEMIAGSRSHRGLSRAEQGLLDDDPFSWDTRDGEAGGGRSRGTSRSASVHETIDEAGESSVTIADV